MRLIGHQIKNFSHKLHVPLNTNIYKVFQIFQELYLLLNVYAVTSHQIFSWNGTLSQCALDFFLNIPVRKVFLVKTHLVRNKVINIKHLYGFHDWKKDNTHQEFVVSSSATILLQFLPFSIYGEPVSILLHSEKDFFCFKTTEFCIHLFFLYGVTVYKKRVKFLRKS